MSAHIVELETIDALVTWSVKRDLLDRMGVSSPDELGQLLHDENVRSVNQRYNETTEPETFKYSGVQDGPISEEHDNLLHVISIVGDQCVHTSNWHNTRANECLAVMECDHIEQSKNCELTLHEARHPMVVEALVAQGRNPNQPNLTMDCPYQNRPLHTARSPEIAMALIDAGADVNGLNRPGETPLHTLARHAEPEVIQALVDRGADPMARDERGNMPLHSTTSYENVAAADVLVNAGADPAAGNSAGFSPIATAEANGRVPDLLAYLKTAILVKQAKESAEQLKANTAEVEDNWAPMRVPSPDPRSQSTSSDTAAVEDDMAPMRVPSPDPTPGQRSSGYSESAQEEESYSIRRF